MVQEAGSRSARIAGLRLVPLLLTVATLSLPLLAGTRAQAADCRSEAEPGRDWSGCNRRNLMLSGSNLEKANLKATDLNQSDLRQSVLTGADFEDAGLGRSSLAEAQADGANFAHIEGYRTDLSNISANGASFRSAELQRSSFVGAKLSGSDFQKAELGRANFEGATLSGNNFAYANLARASFKNAKIGDGLDFTGAYMFLTRIEAVDLSSAKGLVQAQVDMTCGNGQTKLPQGLAAPSAWPCKFD